MNNDKITNKKYKDTVFRLLFNNNKEALGLYNNLYNGHYTDESLINIVTLEDVLFMPRKNDLAFTMNGKFLILLEHQSTINENMPLRFLIYVARLYEKLIDVKKIYKKNLIKIPNPEFTVLYNGSEDLQKNGKKVKELNLKLSDAFEDDEKPQLELKVKVIDIRYSSKHKAVTQNDTLGQYSHFIQIVEDCKKQEKDLDTAMEKAINIAIEQGILAGFLKKNSSEVRNMLTLEYDENIAREVEREEARQEERQKGIKVLIETLKDMDISNDIILQKLQQKYALTEKEAKDYIEKYSK